MAEERKTHSGGVTDGDQTTTTTEYVICEKQSLVELANKVREMGGASGSLNLGQLIEGANVNAADVAREAQLIEQIQSVLKNKGQEEETTTIEFDCPNSIIYYSHNGQVETMQGPQGTFSDMPKNQLYIIKRNDNSIEGYPMPTLEGDCFLENFGNRFYTVQGVFVSGQSKIQFRYTTSEGGG